MVSRTCRIALGLHPLYRDIYVSRDISHIGAFWRFLQWFHALGLYDIDVLVALQSLHAFQSFQAWHGSSRVLFHALAPVLDYVSLGTDGALQLGMKRNEKKVEMMKRYQSLLAAAPELRAQAKDAWLELATASQVRQLWKEWMGRMPEWAATTEATTNKGRLYWRRSDAAGVRWTERVHGQAEPSDRSLWSDRRADVGPGDAGACNVYHGV